MSQVSDTAAVDLLLPLLTAQAAQLARAGRYAEAAAYAAAGLRAHESADLRCLLGKIHAQQGHMTEAEASFRLALSSRPDHQEAAQALQRVERLGGGAPQAPMVRRFAAAAAGLAIGLAWLGYQTLKREPAAVVAAASASASVSVQPGTPTSLAASTLEPASIEAYAAAATRLAPLKTTFGLASRAVCTPDGLTMAISGAVPTAQLLERIRFASSAGVAVDIGAVRIEPSYRVKPKDTLSSIARTVYGDAMGWSRIRDANRELLLRPDVIHVGQELKIPAWP